MRSDDRPGSYPRRHHAGALVTRGRTMLVGALGMALVLAASTQTWLSGTTSDAVLGAASVTATGGQAAPGLLALGLVVLAALVAAMTTGRWLRRVVVIAAVLAAAGALSVAVVAVTDPARVLGPLAATTAGRSGSLPVTGAVLGWAWVGVAGAVVLLVASILAAKGASRWPKPSTRYDSPTAAATVSGPRGERAGTEWDRLSLGEDPTDTPGPGRT